VKRTAPTAGVPSGPGLFTHIAGRPHGTLSAVNGFDPLGYGTHLILDGFRAEASALADGALLEAVLRSALDLMNEGDGVSSLSVQASGDDAGVSAALVAAESQVCIHTFSGLEKLSLEAFSTRSLPTDAIMRTFVERFRVGRFECRVHGRSRLLPKESARLALALHGGRTYARLRLRDLLGS